MKFFFKIILRKYVIFSFFNVENLEANKVLIFCPNYVAKVFENIVNANT